MLSVLCMAFYGDNCRTYVWPSTPLCSKLIPAVPLAATMSCSFSYQRLVHVPIWIPRSSLYVPQSMFSHVSLSLAGVESSKQTTKSALSTLSTD